MLAKLKGRWGAVVLFDGLSDRKIRILEAIVTDYIATAEPVGSRTIAKKFGLGVSSATIRNEMSDLEELGLIAQTHASSGRVPSDSGYRLYVDSLMRGAVIGDETADMLKSIIVENLNEIDYMMKETARAVAALTHYAVIAAAKKGASDEAAIKYLRLIPVDENSAAIALVAKDKTVRNAVIKMEGAPDSDEFNRLSEILNDGFSGLTVSDLSSRAFEKVIGNVCAAFGAYGAVVPVIADKVRDMLGGGDAKERVVTSGIKNLLAFPEFSDIDAAKTLFQTLEERDMLVTFLGGGKGGGDDDIQILIGGENNLGDIRNCSVIKASFNFGDGRAGAVGVLGPTRMNYPQVVAVLAAIEKNIRSVVRS